MRQRLILAERAHQLMMADCRAHPDTETGGILVGRSIAGDSIVPFVVPAGTGAERSPAGFAPDSNFQQPFLDFLFDRFGADYVGDYHRHPGCYDRPSPHDLVTAMRIVTDPDWNMPAACFPILTLQGGNVQIRAFLMAREARTFREMDVEIVPDTDGRIQAVLVGEVPILNERKEVSDGILSPRRPRRGSFFSRFRWF